MPGIMLTVELGASPSVEAIATFLADWRFRGVFIILELIVSFGLVRIIWRRVRAWRDRRRR